MGGKSTWAASLPVQIGVQLRDARFRKACSVVRSSARTTAQAWRHGVTGPIWAWCHRPDLFGPFGAADLGGHGPGRSFEEGAAIVVVAGVARGHVLAHVAGNAEGGSRLLGVSPPGPLAGSSAT